MHGQQNIKKKFKRMANLLVTALRTSLVTVKLPACLTTSGERHVQNLTGEEFFKKVGFYGQVCFLRSLLCLCKYKRNWIKLVVFAGSACSMTSVCGYKRFTCNCR